MRKGLFDKPAITTNNTVPLQPERPAVLKPAKGPVISTHDEPVVVQVLDEPGLVQELPERDVEDASKSNKLLNDVLVREAHDEAAQAGLSIAPKRTWGRKPKG